MATLRFIVSDILTILKQIKDDKEISFNHALYWTLVYADRLKSQHIKKIDSGAYLHQYISVPVLTDPVTRRKYFDLPTGVYDFDLDGGIEYISYNYSVDMCTPAFTSVTFTRTAPSIAWLLYATPEEMPTPDDPYFYRIQNRVWLLGVECIDVPPLEIGIYSTFDPTTLCDIDAPFDFPDELLPILQQQILSLGRFLLQIPVSFANLGTENDDTSTAASQAKAEQQMLQAQQPTDDTQN